MIIAVTPGDPAGVGPELLWKLLRSRERFGADLLCVGARAPFEKLGAPIHEVTLSELSSARRIRAPKKNRPFVWLLPAPNQAPKSARGPLHLEGYQSGWSIKTATVLAQKGIVGALTTGPISKERFQRGGFPFPGHTEFLAHLCGAKNVTMMLANDQLRITLVTTHLALSGVPKAITQPKIIRTVLQTVEHLRHWWKIKRPRIAVAALNPHAGESGLFGNEEIRIIQPALDHLRRIGRERYQIDGPLPADTLFAKHVALPPKDRYDAVVCMYHDQGLIPVKLLDFPQTVNITLGLPIVRTSVDHGVGFDIVGTGRADPSSLRSAIRLAAKIARIRA